MMKSLSCVTVICLSLVQLHTVQSHRQNTTSTPLVTTPSNGIIRGTRVASKMGRSIEVFLGIPFAEPPLGHLRFKRPQPVKQHQGELDATKAKPGCLQLKFKYGDVVDVDNGDTTEDCLYVNVFVPRKSESAEYYEDDEGVDEEEKLPVLVFLYGGAYIWGENQLAVYDGVEFAAEADAIVVTVNYRLNLFGFLNSTTSDIPGNMGLWDQHMALQWVRDNIAVFGGDPAEVTLAGQSAGAMSAAIHSFSSISKGLFKRVIMMSGTSLSVKFLQQTPPEDIMRAIALVLNCFDIDPAISAKCVIDKEITHRELKEIEKELGAKWYNFGPHSGDILVPYPIEELHRNKYHVKDMMLGTTQREGDFMFNALQEWIPSLANGLETSPESTLRLTIKMLFGVRLQDTRKLFNEYLSPNDGDSLPRDQALRIGSDIISHAVFECPAHFFADHAATQGVHVRHYVYAHNPSVQLNLNLGPESTHTDDLPFVLGSINALPENVKMYGMKTPAFLFDAQKRASPEEHHFSRVIIQLISNFMRTGKPRIPGSQKEWPLYSAEDPQIVYMAPNNFTVVRGLKTDKCSLWEPYILANSRAENKDPFGIFIDWTSTTIAIPYAALSTQKPKEESNTTLASKKPKEEGTPSMGSDGSNVIRRGKVLRRTQEQSQSAAASDFARSSSLVLSATSLWVFLFTQNH